MSGPRVLLGVAIGVGLGLGLAIASPGTVAELSRKARPAAKRFAKGALLAYARGRRHMAELREEAEDLVAEVEAELMEEQSAETAAWDGGKEDGPVETEPDRTPA